MSMKVLLLLCDVPQPNTFLRELAKVCIAAQFTMLVAFSLLEAGRYIETLKAYEKKSSDLLHGRVAEDKLSQLSEALTSIKSMNKTDVVTLTSTFGSLHDIIHAPADYLRLCPGFGQQKVDRVVSAFSTPFVTASKGRQPKRFHLSLRKEDAPIDELTEASDIDDHAKEGDDEQPRDNVEPHAALLRAAGISFSTRQDDAAYHDEI